MAKINGSKGKAGRIVAVVVTCLLCVVIVVGVVLQVYGKGKVKPSNWFSKSETEQSQPINGIDGINGTDGKDGVTPHIGDNGNWFIGETDTGVKAQGVDGKDGVDGINGVDGKDGVNGTDGKDGVTPHIGDNGNWFIGETDTGVKAQGVDGKDGKDGANGVDGVDGKDGVTPHIGDNGNWYIGETDTGVKAQGVDGKDGKDGVSGSGESVNQTVSFDRSKTNTRYIPYSNFSSGMKISGQPRLVSSGLFEYMLMFGTEFTAVLNVRSSSVLSTVNDILTTACSVAGSGVSSLTCSVSGSWLSTDRTVLCIPFAILISKTSSGGFEAYVTYTEYPLVSTNS